MSEKLGPRVLGRNHDMPFLGREMGNEPDYSEEIAREIDDEIRRVIEEAHDTATRVLKEHSDELHRISMILIERETIDKEQFERLLAGEAEEAVFPDESPAPAATPEAEDEGKRKPEPKRGPEPVHPLRGGQAVRDGDDRAAFANSEDCPFNCSLRRRIEARRRLVEDDHGRVGQRDACDSDELALTGREAHPSRLHIGRQSVREA